MKKKFLAFLLALAVGSAFISGCGTDTPDDTENKKEAAVEADGISEEDISVFITGTEDRFVLAGSTDIDYLTGVLYDGAVVKQVTADTSDIQSGEGEYKISYVALVDEKALETAVKPDESAEDPFKDWLSASEQEELSDEEAAKLTSVEIEHVVSMVSEEDAKAYAAEGFAVWTDGNVLLTVDEEDVAEEETSDAGTDTEKSDKPAAQNDKPSKGNDKKDAGKTDSKPSGGSTACNHNWVAQTKTVHHDAVTHQEWISNNVWFEETPAWDEAIYGYQTVCKGCGAVNPSYEHLNECLAGTKTISVVTGYKHHEATGHYEDRGTYQTVTDSPAWDETVTNGYKCTKCGAKK